MPSRRAGCDVGVSEIELISTKSGVAPVRTETRGCGWAIASPETMDAVVSWKACTPPEQEEGRRRHRLSAPAQRPRAKGPQSAGGRSNPSPWMMRPGGKEAALATAQTTGTGPGSTRSSGLWLVDLRTGEFKDLAPAAGAEQFP